MSRRPGGGLRLWRAGTAFAVVSLAAVSGLTLASSGPAGATAPAQFGTPLPAGWEMCVLQGLGAPVTPDNVADLDEWQNGEGGSTNNDNAYNPFNTRRDSDQSGNALPATFTSTDFPAFDNWPAGCEATDATILQPNMDRIAAALVAGNVTPPSVFLWVVDSTPWCAPSGGEPCYMWLIATSAVPDTTNVALSLFDETNAAIAGYQSDVAQTAGTQDVLDAEQQQLQAAQGQVQVAQQSVHSALATLRNLALADYMSSNAINPNSNLRTFADPSASQLVAQYYESVDTTDQVAKYVEAQSAFSQAQSERDAAAAAVASMNAALTTAEAAEDQELTTVGTDIAAFQAAGACSGLPTVDGDSATTNGPVVTALQNCIGTLAGSGATSPPAGAASPPTSPPAGTGATTPPAGTPA